MNEKFEYDGIYTQSDGQGLDSIMENFNEWGEMGWQIVSINKLESPPSSSSRWYVTFMRRIN